MMSYFSLAAFKFLSLTLSFVGLIMICPSVNLFDFHPTWSSVNFLVRLGHAFNTQTGSLYLCLSLYFLLLNSLKMCQRWEFRAFSSLSWIYTHHWTCVHSYTCTWTLFELVRNIFITRLLKCSTTCITECRSLTLTERHCTESSLKLAC